MERLAQALNEKGVNYLDLFALLGTQSKELYYKTDTHWNPDGALLASNALLAAAGRDEITPDVAQQPTRITGDLELMLYPLSAGGEDSLALDAGAWRYDGSATSVEDDSIDTRGEGEGALLMFRDSFANTLIGLLAPQFDQAHFSKLVPYNLTETQGLQAGTVVIERAERHIGLLGEEAPYLLAPTVLLETEPTSETGAELETGAAARDSSTGEESSTGADSAEGSSASWYNDGDFRVIEGWVDASLMSANSELYLEIRDPSGNKAVYVPFYLTLPDAAGEDGVHPYGFKLYLDEHSLTDGSYSFRVLISSKEYTGIRTALTTTDHTKDGEIRYEDNGT
jgi:hypothetical protein